MQNSSEVARILENIRLNYESAHLALHGPAIVGRHEIISRKMESMQQAHEELRGIVGDDAIRLVAEVLTDAPEEKSGTERFSVGPVPVQARLP